MRDGLKDVSYEQDGEVAIVTLNRPRYRNARGWRMLDELDSALERAASDRGVKVAIVRGAANTFAGQ